MLLLQPDNAEIRFVADGSTCRITLSSEGQSKVTVFNGLFENRRQRFIIVRIFSLMWTVQAIGSFQDYWNQTLLPYAL